MSVVSYFNLKPNECNPWRVMNLAKRTKKNDADQKNKKGFDSAVINQEFAHEFGSAAANKAHKEKAKKEKASKNNGKYKGQ
ncbi:hypothetical protein BSG1_07074 [Bacillus sp. SG-1]|nr:hypothetical protein BSG1_07074 [Bacillus sp. SG-1]